MVKHNLSTKTPHMVDESMWLQVLNVWVCYMASQMKEPGA